MEIGRAELFVERLSLLMEYHAMRKIGQVVLGKETTEEDVRIAELERDLVDMLERLTEE